MVYTESDTYTAVRRHPPHHCTRSPPEAMPLPNRGVLSAAPCTCDVVSTTAYRLLPTAKRNSRPIVLQRPEFWLGLCEIEMGGTTVQSIRTVPIRRANKEPKFNAV